MRRRFLPPTKVGGLSVGDVNSVDPTGRVIKPGAGGEFGIELGLVGAAFQQLGHMQHMIENAPVLTRDGKQFDRDAVKNEIMKKLPDANRNRLGVPPLTAGGNASDAGRQQSAGMNPTEKRCNRNNVEAVKNRSSSTVCLRT
jgi:hypothetical protein